MHRIDALRLFVDVVDAGSFSRVARARALATSTVTLAVRQLEDEAGVRLLARSTRRLSPTHEGDALRSDARRILAEWDAALANLTQDGRLSGPLNVTATNDFGRNRLRPLLDAFQARHPATTVRLLLSDSTLDLIEDRIDLALRYGPLPDSGLLARQLLPSRRTVCAAPSYWQRHGRPAHPRELVEHNCLVLARAGAPLALWPFREQGRDFHVRVQGDRQASDGELLRLWGEEGMGVILKNSVDVARSLAGGLLVPALEDYAGEPANLYAVLPGADPPRRVSGLLAFLAEALASTAGEA